MKIGSPTELAAIVSTYKDKVYRNNKKGTLYVIVGATMSANAGSEGVVNINYKYIDSEETEVFHRTYSEFMEKFTHVEGASVPL